MEQPENNGEDFGRSLVPQAHGGALRRGGKPGNRGGKGRPKDGIKLLLRSAFEAGLEQACTMLSRRELLPAELAKLLDVVGKYCVASGPLDSEGDGGEASWIEAAEPDALRAYARRHLAGMPVVRVAFGDDPAALTARDQSGT